MWKSVIVTFGSQMAVTHKSVYSGDICDYSDHSKMSVLHRECIASQGVLCVVAAAQSGLSEDAGRTLMVST